MLTATNPNELFSVLLSGASSAVDVAFKLLVIYAVWFGFIELLEKNGLGKKISALLSPLTRVLFGKIDNEANELVAFNVTANMLGMGGAATPIGISAVNKLYEDKNERAMRLFFVINATSLQIISTSVIGLRQSFNSLAPFDCTVPTLIVTLVSTIFGVLLMKLLEK